MSLRYLEKLLSIGHDAVMSERLARHVRISNAVALVGAVLAVASLPFDFVTGPPWFALWDLVALAGFATCWLLNALGRTTASRVAMLIVANLVFAYSSAVLGEQSRQSDVFFALATLPFFVFASEERLLLWPFLVLPIVGYFVSDAIGPFEMRPYSVRAYRFYSPTLAFVGIVLGSLVSARTNRRAEDALEHARARGVASARMAALGEMASGVAHEIRNPLAAIGIAIDQIAESGRVEDAHALAARCKRIVARISTITDALSAFGRDASADPFVTADVARIIGDTLELCQRRFAAHQIQLTAPTVSESLALECRPVQVSQILLNLLNNAHDAVESAVERWVRLEVRADAEHVELAVVDSGPGVPREVRDRIFEPFFTTKGPDRGTGLGLGVSRGLAQAHRGTLELDDRAAHTRFVLRLPRRQLPAA